MPVKIRLQRHGRKGKPFYHIVVADSRAPRDGKFIEKIGIYNPLTNPATIELDVNQAVTWLKNGAQPTDTTHAILSYKGALYKRHLDIGVQKGALTSEDAEAKFNSWLEAKESKISGKKASLSSAQEQASKSRLQEESKIKEERKKALEAKKTAAELAAQPAPEVSENEEEVDKPALEAPAPEEGAG